MSVDLTSVVVAVIGLIGLVVGGSGGLIALIRADRAKKKENAAAKVKDAPREEASVMDLMQKLARDALTDADGRLDDARDDARSARQEASAARLEAADARALVDLLSRQLAQATQHIRDLEPLLTAKGIRVPPWPPDPENQTPVISNDRRVADRDFDGPDQRRHHTNREEP